LLLHQSTGNETEDIITIKERLLRGKKVTVKVSGFQDEVRTQIEALFGRGSVTEMKLASKDPASLTELWHCTLYQTADIKLDISQLLYKQEKPPLLAFEFVHGFQSHIQSSSLTTSYFDLSVVLHKTQEFMERTGLINHLASVNNVSGFIAEKAFLGFIQSQLPERIKQSLQLIHSDDTFPFQDASYRVGASLDTEQISFEHTSSINDCSDSLFMNVDFLFRLSDSGEYVAFDVTVNPSKKFKAQKREKKLTLLSQALGKNIILIDVVLTKKMSYPLYLKISDHLYRWHLPCKIDFQYLALGLYLP
jgi:hypothetical protein